jgi:glycosidase
MKRLLLAALLAASPAAAQDFRQRPPEDEVIYFVLPDRFENGDTANDRGGLKGDRLTTGFDPSHKGFYHGGDLKGLIRRLDYLQGLGATAIWVGPIFRNKPVQGPKGQESAGYHGYWITDFTQVDPHLGSNADFKALVDAAHARGMKVYMDIIANHTADVIQYKGCPVQACDYRSIADYPFQRRGGVAGVPINPGFAGDTVRTAENFAKLDDPSFAYQPYVPAPEKSVKVPAWLNDPLLYHNRGNFALEAESARYGDFSGLDDLATENPRVVSGMIDIFGDWIDRYGVDGFRIDTAKHVNPEFWQAFVPAMLARAKARGIPNFHIFGEVYSEALDPGYLAQFTHRDGYPAVLDFAFQVAARDIATGKSGTDAFLKLTDGDILYKGGGAAARQLPIFLGNHDMGRIGHMLDRALPAISDEERLARASLAHVLMMTARGVPTIYSGDEQGFTGDGGDQAAREDMFPSKVASYNDNRLIGTNATTATENFDTAHPLYRLIADLAALRAKLPALRRGDTVVRAATDKPGLLAFSRVEPGKPEVLVLLNSAATPATRNVKVDVASTAWSSGWARTGCPIEMVAPGSVRVTLPPFGYAICDSTPLD